MNCFRSCAGSAGFTTSTPGGPPKSAMWVKSRSGSNGKLFESAGAMQCVATPETTSVYPSGAAFATSSEPMMPPAPARFSTMKFSFKISLSLCDTRRPSVSAVPPGAKGTMMRTVLAGHPCARACEPAISRATSPASPGPECRASCESEAATGVILPEHRARIAERPPRTLRAAYRNGNPMEITGEQLIPVPQAEVWRGLNEPEVLKACIAGCEAIERVSDTEYRVVMVASVGPVKAKFNGKLVLSDLNPPNSYSLSFEGSGGAAGFGKGSAQVSLKTEGSGTRLSYSAKASVGGKLAQVGSRLIDGVARKMADDFFTAFNEKLAGPAAARAAAPAIGKRRVHPAWWVAGALFLVFLVYLALQPAH